MDGVNTSWTRLSTSDIQETIKNILQSYSLEQPEKSVPALVKLYKSVSSLPSSGWKSYKLDQIKSIIQSCAGLFVEATTQQQQVIPGSILPIQFSMNQRMNVPTMFVKLSFPDKDSIINSTLLANQNIQIDYKLKVPESQPISQPYWLVQPKLEGMFVVDNQQLIGKAENDPAFPIKVSLQIQDQLFTIDVPVKYKYLDPTKGEVYQPIAVIPAQEVKYEKEVNLINGAKPISVAYHVMHFPNVAETKKVIIKNQVDPLPTPLGAVYHKSIAYDHIPTITYFPSASTHIVNVDIKTMGSKIGYIEGAGDKLPEALVELGYQVTYLKESDLLLENLATFDAIVVGIRAYNLYDYLSDHNDVINKYIEQGGNVIVQYLKSNQVGINKVKVGPYAFTVGAKRVTQEDVPVEFTLPNHIVLNTPNKITAKDFENWVQERSTYQADNIDGHFEMPLTMSDDGEAPSNGSLLIAPFGKGNFVYLSLTLFRQLPAGNPGAFKLLANLIALPKH